MAYTASRNSSFFFGTTAHLDTFFKKADKDRSGDISLVELGGNIDSILK
jgi:hypothetical protein